MNHTQLAAILGPRNTWTTDDFEAYFDLIETANNTVATTAEEEDTQ